MFTGTLAANTPLSKQKKYPKVRRRENARENYNDDTNAFTYAQLESFEDDESYIETDLELEWINNNKVDSKESTKKETTGSDYIKKLLQEEEELKKEKENAGQKDKEVTRKTGRQEEEAAKDPFKLDDSHLRHLLKEKDTLEVDFGSSRVRSRSNGDISSSFLSNVLKESLFAAGFTVPTVEGTAEPLRDGGITRDDSSATEKPRQRRKSVPSKLGISSSGSKLPSRKNSKEKMSPNPRNKDNLVKGLQKSIFQPQLFVQNNNDLASSCPNLAQASQRAKSPPPGILAHALKPANVADAMGSRSSKENVLPGTSVNLFEKDAIWERVEIINRERKLSAPQSPILSDLVQDALRNSWFAINLPSVILSPEKASAEASAATSPNFSPESTTTSPWPNSEMRLSSTNSALAEEFTDVLNFNEEEPKTGLPTVIIDTPVTEDIDKSEVEGTFRNDFSFEDDFNPDTFAENNFTNFSSQSTGNEETDTVSEVAMGSQSLTSSSVSKRWKCEDDRKKSIMDVLEILRSIQGDSEYGFFEDRCCASGPGLAEGFVDEPATFHLVLMDKPDLINLFVIIEGPGILQPRTEYTPLTKNIIRVVYWPERVGRYTIRILWKNREIPGSPFKPIILLPKCEVWIKRVL